VFFSKNAFRFFKVLVLPRTSAIFRAKMIGNCQTRIAFGYWFWTTWILSPGCWISGSETNLFFTNENHFAGGLYATKNPIYFHICICSVLAIVEKLYILPDVTLKRLIPLLLEKWKRVEFHKAFQNFPALRAEYASIYAYYAIFRCFLFLSIYCLLQFKQTDNKLRNYAVSTIEARKILIHSIFQGFRKLP
jgi:hypothetical protein